MARSFFRCSNPLRNRFVGRLIEAQSGELPPHSYRLLLGLACPPAGVGLRKVLFGGGSGPFEAGLEFAPVLPGALQCLEPLGGAVLGAGESLPQLAPARELLRDPSQLLLGGGRGGGELLGLLV